MRKFIDCVTPEVDKQVVSMLTKMYTCIYGDGVRVKRVDNDYYVSVELPMVNDELHLVRDWRVVRHHGASEVVEFTPAGRVASTRWWQIFSIDQMITIHNEHYASRTLIDDVCSRVVHNFDEDTLRLDFDAVVSARSVHETYDLSELFTGDVDHVNFESKFNKMYGDICRQFRQKILEIIQS